MEMKKQPLNAVMKKKKRDNNIKKKEFKTNVLV